MIEISTVGATLAVAQKAAIGFTLNPIGTEGQAQGLPLRLRALFRFKCNAKGIVHNSNFR